MEPLQPDTSYHIFNHANGFENVFRKEENFYYFLEKYRLYISPIAETYAYCLMPNHFHLVVRIRKRATIEELIRNKNNIKTKINFSKVSNFGKVVDRISDSELEKYLSKQFANLFSCYTQSFNKVYNRMGSLFIKNFKRNPIYDKNQFLHSVIYTHRNPIHHGFCKGFDEWEFSSYHEIIDSIIDFLELAKLLKMFGDRDVFIEMHQANLECFNQSDDLEIP